jgi:hypothetical protein
MEERRDMYETDTNDTQSITNPRVVLKAELIHHCEADR